MFSINLTFFNHLRFECKSAGKSVKISGRMSSKITPKSGNTIFNQGNEVQFFGAIHDSIYTGRVASV